MNKILDLRKEEKVLLNIILPDGSSVEIYTPSKYISDLFPIIGEKIKKITKPSGDDIEGYMEAIDFLYEATALIISRNKNEITYKAADIKKLMSDKQMLLFLTNYSTAIKEILNSKN